MSGEITTSSEANSAKDTAPMLPEGSVTEAEDSNARLDSSGPVTGPRNDSRPGSRADSRPGSRADSRPGSQTDSRPGSKAESRPGSRADSRPGSREDSRPGSRTDSRPGSKADSRDSRPGSSADARPGSRADSRPGSRADARPGSRADSRSGSRADSRPGSRADCRPGSRADSRPGSRADSRPGSRADSRPGSRADSRLGSTAEPAPSLRPSSRPGSAAGSVLPDSASKEAESDGPATDSGGPCPGDVGNGDSPAAGGPEALTDGIVETESVRSLEVDGSLEGEKEGETDGEKEKTGTARGEPDVETMEVDEVQTPVEEEALGLTVEKEELDISDRSFTVIGVGLQDDDDTDNPGQKRSPVKHIRVISAASVATLGVSEDEDDPVPIPSEDINGDITEVPNPQTANDNEKDKNKEAGADGGAAQTNGGSPGGGDDSITVLGDKASDKPAMYGVVSTYKEQSGSVSASVGDVSRPLAVRGLSSLAMTIGSAAGTGPTSGATTPTSGVTVPTSGVTVPTSGVTVAGAALLSSRTSKCIICNWVKPIKYMMMANGASGGNVICSDECLEKCVNNVKSGRMSIMTDGRTVSTPPPPISTTTTTPTLTVSSVTSLSTAPAEPPAAPAPAPAPSSRPGRTVCQNAECGRLIPTNSAARQSRTVWETMVFCSPACAVQHQKKDGSACVFCKMSLPEMIMGKYCVRFGSDVRQFCSNLCLDGFKKRLKVCSYCQRDITRFQGSFLAPVGNAGSHQFKEFCSQSCLTRYKTTHGDGGKGQTTWAKCSVCLKHTPVEHKVAVKPDEPAKPLCSQICLKAYKFAIKEEGPLDTCAVCKTLLVVNNLAEFRVWNGSAVAYLCSQSCSNVFVLSNRRIVACRYCKVKKYNFDMVEVTSEKDGLYCSVHCLKSCGKRITPRRDKRPSCARCGVAVDSASFTSQSGSVSVFCGTKCAQADVQERRNGGSNQPGAPNGPSSGDDPVQLPQIQSVISLADDDPSPTETSDPATTADSAKTSDPARATEAARAKKPGKKTGAGTPRLLPAARNHPALVLMPPAPVTRRNVSVQVQPKKAEGDGKEERVVERAEGEQKQTATISTQTDPALSVDPRVLPVPVPMYVPAPMAMYNCPYPLPVPLLVPVPVPLLCGGEDALRLLCGLPTVHNTQPTVKEGSSSERPAPGKRRHSSGPPPDPGSDCGLSPPGSPGLDASDSPDTADRPPPHKRRKVEERAPDESGTPSPRGSPAPEGNPVDLVSLLRAPPSDPHCRRQSTQPTGTEFLGASDESHACHTSSVKYTWCVRVFVQFIKERNRRPPPPSDSDSDSETQERLVADPLQATPTELAAGLRAMVRELRRPTGEPYPPDIVHYILLGIQMYLLEHRRGDSLFWGESYAELTAALEERLRPVGAQLQQAVIVSVSPLLEPPGRQLTTHVEEEQLWEAKVLGAHSPQALLTTVAFFVTKHFLIGTLGWHQKLSFAMLQESIDLKVRLKQSSLKLLDSRNVYKRSKTYEMPANTDDPFRCPVRFLEFYLSRCPEWARSGRSPLYLTPAADGRPDGSAWFSPEPLPLSALQQLLSRLLTVRQLQTALLSGAGS